MAHTRVVTHACGSQARPPRLPTCARKLQCQGDPGRRGGGLVGCLQRGVRRSKVGAVARDHLDDPSVRRRRSGSGAQHHRREQRARVARHGHAAGCGRRASEGVCVCAAAPRVIVLQSGAPAVVAARQRGGAQSRRRTPSVRAQARGHRLTVGSRSVKCPSLPRLGPGGQKSHTRHTPAPSAGAPPSHPPKEHSGPSAP